MSPAFAHRRVGGRVALELLRPSVERCDDPDRLRIRRPGVDEQIRPGRGGTAPSTRSGTGYISHSTPCSAIEAVDPQERRGNRNSRTARVPTVTTPSPTSVMTSHDPEVDAPTLLVAMTMATSSPMLTIRFLRTSDTFDNLLPRSSMRGIGRGWSSRCPCAQSVDVVHADVGSPGHPVIVSVLGRRPRGRAHSASGAPALRVSATRVVAPRGNDPRYRGRGIHRRPRGRRSPRMRRR